MSKPLPTHKTLTFIRLILVVSALSPVFLLWAIRGVTVLKDCIWVPICLGLFFLFNGLVIVIWYGALRARNEKTITVRKSSEQREYLITYLLAVTIPLYQNDIDTWRSLLAACLIFVFVVYVFWWVRLGYINLIFALCGYRVHTIEVAASTKTGNAPRITHLVFISRREFIEPGEVLTGLRLGSDVLIERADR